MSLQFGVSRVTSYAYPRAMRPTKLVEHVTQAFRNLSANESICVGVSDLAGGWKKEFIETFKCGETLKFLDWLTQHRNSFVGDEAGFTADPLFIILVVRETFNPKDPCHEQEAAPEVKGFYRILREEEYEPMET